MARCFVLMMIYTLLLPARVLAEEAGGLKADSALFSNLLPVAGVIIIVLTVAVAVMRRLKKLRFARQRGYAGSQLQTQVVKTFSIVAIIPTLVISIFSIFFFYFGIKDWFSQRISTVLEESVAVAEAYLEEHKSTLRADAMAMANDLSREMHLAITNPAVFEQILNGQVVLRSLSEAMIIQRDREIARSLLSFSLTFESLPDHVLQTANNGEVAIMDRDDRIFAVVAIDSLTETYLVISRLVDSKVLEHIEQSMGAAENYERLKTNINNLQVIFVVVFVLVTLVLLLSVIWYGVNFASRIAIPLITLAQATERVRTGDYSIQIEEDSDNEEMDMLIHHFNRMTEQLYSQRMELTQVTRMLDQRRRFTETVLSGVSAGIIALDTNLVVSLSNASAMRLLGFRHEHDMIGRSLRTLAPEFSSLVEKAMRRESDIHQDQITIRRLGKTLTLQVKFSAEISESYIEGFIVTLDDITPLISAQRSAAWSDVARRVAHEIKNPLTPIKLSVDRLRKKFPPSLPEDQEAYNRYLDTISRHLRDIATIIEEFSSFARMPAPKLVETPLQPLLANALFSAETIHPEIEYKLFGTEEYVTLNCDEAQINQVLTNLLKNAAESIHRREDVQERGYIHIYYEQTDQQIMISIVDNGVGFPEELLHRIMEPYVTTRAKGTGLGLAIVKKIIEDHKGNITVGNQETCGAIVTLTFPRTFQS